MDGGLYACDHVKAVIADQVYSVPGRPVAGDTVARKNRATKCFSRLDPIITDPYPREKCHSCGDLSVAVTLLEVCYSFNGYVLKWEWHTTRDVTDS